jgi:translation initiation factor 2 subunit 1
MIDREYPDEGELVVGTVVKVQNFGAFVTLDEYPNREGFIHIAEIAAGWIKRIRNHVKEKQKVVCKVLHVDKLKGHIDLSLKRVNEHQKRDKIQEWKNRQKADKLIEMLSVKLGKSVDGCFKEFADRLIEKYDSLYGAFEEAAYDIETLKKDGFKGEWLNDFEEIAKSNISIPFVEINGYVDITSWKPDGVNYIIKALIEGQKTEYDDVKIHIKYIAAPKYMITVKAPDYKIAEDELKKAVERVEESIKSSDGVCVFHRKIEE